MSDKVAVLRAAGMDRQQIADAIGYCKKTLETYFLPSLTEGRAAKRAEAIARLYQLGVIDGHVTALKAYIAMTERADFVPDVPGKIKAPRLGKKEQLAAEAHSGHEEPAGASCCTEPCGISPARTTIAPFLKGGPPSRYVGRYDVGSAAGVALF